MTLGPKRLAVAAGVTILLAIGAYLNVELTRNHVETLAPSEGTMVIEEPSWNPVRDLRDELDREALELSLRCVDSQGLMTCGRYSGNPALLYAVLVGSHEDIRELSDRANLVRYGEQAVANGAALGDLETVNSLITLGESYGLVDDTLDGYPLFEGGYDQGAHPAGTAAAFGQLDVLSYFVNRGFDVNMKLTDDGITDVFLEAINNRQIEVLRYLLAAGYEIDCSLRFPNERSYAQVVDIMKFEEGVNIIRDACG